MGFLDKAKKSLQDAQHMAEGFKEQLHLGESAGQSHSETATPIATPATTAVPTPAASERAPSIQVNDLNVPHSTAPGAPTKVPLADRKKIRDDFESKKSDLEKEFSKVLGGQWTIHVDTAGVYTYMGNDSNALKNPGVYIHNYFSGALNHLQYFVTKYGASDAATITTYAPRRLITLEPTSKESVTYVDTDFLDGRWRLLFRDTKFGWNASDCAKNIAEVLNSASKTSGGSTEMSLNAKKGIRDEYEKKIPAVLGRAQQYLAEPGLVFDPNFEANYATLAAFSQADGSAKLRQDWEKTLGPATLNYFEGFTSQLDWQKFSKDDMMQEGFKEAVPKLTVSFLVTPDVARTRNDCIIIDGGLVMRCKPDAWWTNANDTCDKLADLL